MLNISMKKVLVFCLAIFLLAAALNQGIDITGWFVKASSTIVSIARTVIKEVLSLIVKVL